MSTSTHGRTPTITWRWVGRVVASVFLILGSLVFVTFLDTGSLAWLAVAFVGAGGALVYSVGLERPGHPLSARRRRLGWLLMAAFSLIPTSLLFGPLILVLLALPTLFPRPATS
jgi:hypothetical protein